MEEIWRNCLENYEISNLGNVRRKLLNDNYKVIKCSIQNRGYKYFQTNRANKRTNYLIHHLVARHFIGERPENQVIDHIDRNKLNNNVSNLRYCTQKKNCENQDKYIADIEETDPVKRNKLVCKRYVDNNRDSVLKQKREYYKINKDKMLKKYKDDQFNIICSLCKAERFVGRCSYNRIKRGGIDANLCRTCSCKINLPKR